ncbi:MAG: dihydroorotate dehydrogenase electron transfer subunit [Endomicrobium sp.]|jgi:dihydroorotate dehydrogenase electron transfer subunit|nr:dihydroorotate dehydrogenase electron transfer subunit [Endomicrobium sp.]
MKKYCDKTYKIISNTEIGQGYFELKIQAGAALLRACKPGQFFMLTIPGVFLRRPLSVHDAKDGEISFLYKVVGKGTKILSRIKTGGLSALGALGNGYPLDTPLLPIIVAGGTGIASVYFLASKLKNKGILYYGARSKKDLLCLDKFKKLGWKIVVSTEDGSKGFKGYITDALEKQLTANKEPSRDAKLKNLLFVCGPNAMMKAVFKIAKEKNIKGFASLEEKMACGIGNCQGCAVKINGQNKMTCKDGPVFKIEDIEF